MAVENVFSIQGRGTVITGKQRATDSFEIEETSGYRLNSLLLLGAVEQGVIKVGDEIELVGLQNSVKAACTGVEMFRKQVCYTPFL